MKEIWKQKIIYEKKKEEEKDQMYEEELVKEIERVNRGKRKGG